MNFQFEYACSCKIPKKLTVKDWHESNYQRRMKDLLDKIVDQAWDKANPEALLQLPYASHNNDLLDYLDDPSASREKIPTLKSSETEDLAIMESVCKQMPPGNVCACTALIRSLSTVVEAGLEELHIVPLPEESLLEKLQLLKPFVRAFQEDDALYNFFIRLWKLAIPSSNSQLIKTLAQIYPQFLSALVDGLMKVQATDYESLRLRNEFQYLARCLRIGESFYATLSYLASLNRVRAQPLISACMRVTKDRLSREQYYALFPMRIRSYAIVLNETTNPNDPDLEMLIVQLKNGLPHDYRVLCMIYPGFSCLDDRLPPINGS